MAKTPAPAADGADNKAGKSIGSLKNLPIWVREHRVKAAVAISIFLSVVGGLLFTWALMQAKSQQAEREKNYTTADSFTAIAEGDYPKALFIAQCVEKSGNFGTDGAGGPAFIYALAAMRRADTPLESQRLHSFKVAAYWFEESRRFGFPPERAPDGEYQFAKSLFYAGRYADAIPAVRRALEANPHLAAELHYYAAVSHFLQSHSDIPAALSEIERCLSVREPVQGLQSAARLARAELLLRSGRAEEARQELQSVLEDDMLGPEALVLAARLDLNEARKLRPADDAKPDQIAAADAARRKLYDAGVAALNDAQSRDRLSTSVAPKAFYVRGLFDLELDRIDEAADAFHKAYRRSVDSPEGVAARLESARIAELRGKFDEAVRLYREVLGEIGNLHDYSNRWYSLDELRSRVLEVYRRFLEGKEFAAAAAMAESLSKVLEEAEAVQLGAEALLAWARSEGPFDVAGEAYERRLSASARQHFREAAALHERLAALRFATRDYPEQIWSAARYYALGRDFAGAERQYRKYLEIEPRAHHSQALVGLAGVMITKERYDEALALLKECLELHPGDPAVHTARLLLAKLYVELNQFQPAEQMLVENLESDSLTPDGEEWRRSLFALGRLHYELGRYPEAAARLDEACSRYPEDPESHETRYRAAEAHRRTAQQIERETPRDSLPAERAKFARRASEEYEAALVRYDDVIKVARTPDQSPLDELGRLSMLRNSVFARGSVLHALARYAEAVQAYQNAVASFPQSPASLDAYLQIADCYRRLDKPSEMRGTLEQAKLMLERLPQDAPFADVTNFDRQQWAKLLEAAGAL